MSEWMPMESAPKDGRDVLLYCDDTEEMFVGFWGDARDGNPKKGWVFARQRDVTFMVDTPSHWMPLPAAPVDGGAQ